MNIRHWIQLSSGLAMLAWAVVQWLYPAHFIYLMVIPLAFAAWNVYFAYWSHQWQRRERGRRGFDVIRPPQSP